MVYDTYSIRYYKLSTQTAYPSERPTEWSKKLHPVTLTLSFVPFHFPLNLVLISHQTNRRKPAVPIIGAFIKKEPPPAPHKSITATSHLLYFLSIAHVHHVINTSVCSFKCPVRDEHVACLLCGTLSALNSSPLTSAIQFQALATSSTGLDAWPGTAIWGKFPLCVWADAWKTHPSETLLYLLASLELWPLLVCHGDLLLLGQVQENKISLWWTEQRGWNWKHMQGGRKENTREDLMVLKVVMWWMGRVGVEVSVAWGEKKRGLEKMGLHRVKRKKGNGFNEARTLHGKDVCNWP